MKKFTVIGLQFAVLLLLICASTTLSIFDGQAWADTKKIEGTTNVEDAYIFEYFPDKNYGGATFIYLAVISGFDQTGLIRVKNVASELGVGATNITAVCSVYCEWLSSSGNCDADRCFKPWVEGDEIAVDDDDGDVTYNDWASDASEWTTEGCVCANDDGVDNSTDDGECDASTKRDRKSTAEDTESITGTGWYGFDISMELAQGWYDGTINEEGIVFVPVAGEWKFTSTEGASNQPFFVFTYTTDGVEAGQVIIVH